MGHMDGRGTDMDGRGRSGRAWAWDRGYHSAGWSGWGSLVGNGWVVRHLADEGLARVLDT
jgi:hypothetical protein